MRFAVLLFFGLWWQQALAQDPQFSQFYSAPFYMNPGFAGNTIQARGVLNYRNQWPSMPGKFISTAASFDYNVEEWNSGFALGVQQDRAGSAGLRYTSLAFQYSYTIQLSRKYAFKPGMYFAWIMRDISEQELIFGDQIVYDNPVSASSGRFYAEPVRYPDMGAGGIFYSRNWWAGAAMHHLNRPNQSLLNGEVRLPIRYTVHGGYQYVIKRTPRKKVVSSASLVAHYKAQLKWDQADFGVYYRYKIITSGLYYRGLPIKRNKSPQPNHDAFTVLLGFEVMDFAFAYSYDLTVSRLVTNSGGAHEVSLILELASERKKKKRSKRSYIIPCAKF